MVTGDELREIDVEKLDVADLARLAGVLDAIADASVRKVVIRMRDGRCIGCGRGEGRLLPVPGLPEALAHIGCADRMHDKMAALLELSRRTVAAFDRAAGMRPLGVVHGAGRRPGSSVSGRSAGPLAVLAASACRV